jgi:hypothetical protein
MMVAGRGRDEMKAPTIPHIVHVLPVPGGLPNVLKRAISFGRKNRNLPLNERKALCLQRT